MSCRCGVRLMADVAEIQAALESAARSYLAEMGDAKPMPGWVVMFRHDVQFQTVGMATIPTLPESGLATLLEMATHNPHAYDAAKYLAAMQIAAGWELPNQLRLFTGQALVGEIERPVQEGRPMANDVLIKTIQFSLAVFTHKRGGLPLARNDVSESFSACDAVAEAFTRAGRHTTYAAVKSLCYDSAYSDIRALGAWLDGQHFMDPKRRLRFADIE